MQNFIVIYSVVSESSSDGFVVIVPFNKAAESLTKFYKGFDLLFASFLLTLLLPLVKFILDS